MFLRAHKAQLVAPDRRECRDRREWKAHRVNVVKKDPW
ncbi:unnamed protein product [Protopolystoma xenopodis]|uniref:Uncharacterized protein n=1 Tax=Protopolystoma xenopodis TaxID=117903 RepID=A0A448WZD5_9PLAT|nr:unnamed protein product [Protopolystoma xenopodis]